MNEKLKQKVIQLLTDLKENGTFYTSAIELDIYLPKSSDGEDYEARINTLLTELKN